MTASLHLARFRPGKAARTLGALWRGRERLAATPGLAALRVFMVAELEPVTGGLPVPTRYGLLCGWEDREARDDFLAGGAERFVHDASEAYLGDMPHPLKHRSPLGAAFKEAEDHLEQALRVHFRIKPDVPEIKRADRALLVPTAHDEPPLRFGLMRDVFERPRVLMCNTPEEVALIQRTFPGHARTRVVGVGVDVPRGQPRRFARAHGLDRPYLLYVGRLEPGKGVHELLQHHRALRERFHDALASVEYPAALRAARTDAWAWEG